MGSRHRAICRQKSLSSRIARSPSPSPLMFPAYTLQSGSVLLPGQMFECDAVLTLTQADVDAGMVQYVASVSGVARDANRTAVSPVHYFLSM